ncbi:MAG: hypothetical protein K6E77_03600 [Lachnospiraceae bacterium]|nr:hypothetical protein [Lachnospiraceae bacterium]
MNEKAIEAKSDQKKREIFIKDNEQTILKIASVSCGKYITRSDDEWSVALLAFDKAIDTYSEDKGNFATYSGVVIKRALIDHHRSEKKYEFERPVSHEFLTGEGDREENSDVMKAVARESHQANEQFDRSISLKEEILEVNERLKKYGFSFRDLKDNSPKAGKTKTECSRAITYILDNKEMLDAVIADGRIPIKELAKSAGVNKKLLDRYRRFIIMAVVILNGEYPLLADYLQYVRKEGSG